MFDLSPEKILFLGVIAIMVLGPDRLPKAARTLAKVLHQVRTASGSLQEEMREVLAEPRKAVSDAVSDLGLPADLGALPRMPTARSLVNQVLAPLPERTEGFNGADGLNATDGSNGAASGRDASTMAPGSEASLPGAAPDDPSLN